MKEENPVMKEKSVVTEKKEPSMKQKDDIEQENKDEIEKDNETTQNNKFNWVIYVPLFTPNTPHFHTIFHKEHIH